MRTRRWPSPHLGDGLGTPSPPHFQEGALGLGKSPPGGHGEATGNKGGIDGGALPRALSVLIVCEFIWLGRGKKRKKKGEGGVKEKKKRARSRAAWPHAQ